MPSSSNGISFGLEKKSNKPPLDAGSSINLPADAGAGATGASCSSFKDAASFSWNAPSFKSVSLNTASSFEKKLPIDSLLPIAPNDLAMASDA